MEEIQLIPAVSWIDEAFHSMAIPGETGFAVLCGTDNSNTCLAIGRSDDVCKKRLLKGNPLVISKEIVVTIAEYNAITARLSEIPVLNGMVVADVIDGESYMIKWVGRGVESRFILSNPHELETERYRIIGAVLKAFFKVEGKF